MRKVKPSSSPNWIRTRLDALLSHRIPCVERESSSVSIGLVAELTSPAEIVTLDGVTSGGRIDTAAGECYNKEYDKNKGSIQHSGHQRTERRTSEVYGVIVRDSGGPREACM